MRRLQMLKRYHTEVFGKLSDDLYISMVRNGVVELRSKNPVWVNEIQRLKKMLLEKMNTLLGKDGRLLDIKVTFDSEFSKNVAQYTSQVASQKQETPPLDTSPDAFEKRKEAFEKRIQLDNQKKKEKGMKLCKKCSQIYTEADCCVFCRTTL